MCPGKPDTPLCSPLDLLSRFDVFLAPISCSPVDLTGVFPQVSLLLTNHLSRAMDRLVVSESGASESLQDALSLLLGLAKSHLGRAILSQPGCISKLLLLLTDQRSEYKKVMCEGGRGRLGPLCSGQGKCKHFSYFQAIS